MAEESGGGKLGLASQGNVTKLASTTSSKLKSVEIAAEFGDLEDDDLIQAADEEIKRLLKNAGLQHPRFSEEDGVDEPIRVLKTVVRAEAEEKHEAKVIASRSYMFFFHVASIILWGVVCVYCIQTISAAFSIFYLPPVKFHFLGFQLLWNTQPYGVVYTAHIVQACSSVYILYLLFDSGAICWKVWQWLTRSRDLGFNQCMPRAKIDYGIKFARLPLLIAAACVAAFFSTWEVPPITDVTYSSTCKVSGAFGRDPTDLALEGNTSGECVEVFNDPVIVETERNYRGEVPDTSPASMASGGGNVTIYMDPYGRELGCPTINPLFPLYNGAKTGELMSYWAGITSRSLRRCLSQKGYIISNWYTFVPRSNTNGAKCDPGSYTQWVNRTGTTTFGHMEQWFCGATAVASDELYSVQYNTTGWLSTLVGPTCLSANDTAASLIRKWPQHVIDALASVRGDGAPGSVTSVTISGLNPSTDLPPNIFTKDPTSLAAAAAVYVTGGSANSSSTSPSSGTNMDEPVVHGHWSPHYPDQCTEAVYSCSVYKPGASTGLGDRPQYLRALSLNGCTRSIQKPMATTSYGQALIEGRANWSAVLSKVTVVIGIEAVIEWLETLVNCFFF
jgi:hypothetical protein